ncbi:hypothetical protein NRY95_10465 [Xanthomonas campestris pv. phormiicola]|nr:hypothetical protein [Xanthomonas campestris pv. phormiicola]UYC18558.1 hypothetical protein NRY95_10465 [Xanthomonas campestris pv. phormiicola]
MNRELSVEDIWAEFVRAYRLGDADTYQLVDEQSGQDPDSGPERMFSGRIRHRGRDIRVTGCGNGLFAATLSSLAEAFGIALDVVDHQEHALRRGADAQTVAYLRCVRPDGGHVFGVGIDADAASARVRAVLSAASAVA